MKTLRQWSLTPSQPGIMQLAADARLSRTSYVDDQVWEVELGSGDQAALALHTRYGGRAGLVSLVPMWTHDGHFFYQALTCAAPPVITRFSTDFVVIQLQLLPHISAEIIVRAMESQVLGGLVTLSNSSQEPQRLRFDLFAHAGMDGKDQPARLLELPGGGAALSPGSIGNLHPALLVEHGDTQSGSASRLGTVIAVKPGGKTTVRFVHAGLPALEKSIGLAQRWLKLDWQPFLAASVRAAAALPAIATGDDDHDAVIATASVRLMQAFLRPAGQFPRGTFVASRTPAEGYSRAGDGSDHPRSWNGQEPLLAYLVAGAAATVDADLARGLVANYLAVQAADGFIDGKPGPAGQRQQQLCLPILARIAWHIGQLTDDEAFLKAVFPGLLRFFERWLAADYDRDGDQVPEWQDERQTGYMAFPTFAAGHLWGQGLNINTVEAPDLLAWLISEADALHHIATRIGQKSALKTLAAQQERLRAGLATLWQGAAYGYRDRDTHAHTPALTLLHDVPGDEDYRLAEPLAQPSRLIVRVVGGLNHVPRLTLTVEGVSESGTKISETADARAFIWHSRQGVYTTQRVFATVDKLRCEGLSRVYRISLSTPDFTRLDVNALLPLWAGGLPDEQTRALVRLATDRAHFWQTNGLTPVSAADASYDPSSAKGAGGIWMPWLTLIGEGLLRAGEEKKVAELLRAVLAMQVQVLRQERAFYQFYHADSPRGSGEKQHLGGLFPLPLFYRAIGIYIVSPGRVWTGGAFAWGRSISVTQHGVTVKRTTRKISLKFASGHKVELPGDAPWQMVLDPGYSAVAAPPLPAPPNQDDWPSQSAPKPAERVIIKVERE